MFVCRSTTRGHWPNTHSLFCAAIVDLTVRHTITDSRDRNRYVCIYCGCDRVIEWCRWILMVLRFVWVSAKYILNWIKICY